MIIKRTAAAVLFALILLSACLCGCSPAPEKGFTIPVSPIDRSFYELCKKQYMDTELEQIYSLMVEENDMAKLDKSYPVECLRKDKDGYHIIYCGKRKILLLSFDQNAAFTEKPKLESIFFVTKTRGYFDELQPGDPIAKVQSIDPTGFYPFLIEGSDAPKVSEHFTEDGYHTTIAYDADLNIVSVDYDVA